MDDNGLLQALLWQLLGLVMLPAWLLAGAADYVAHARTGIEHTSGITESGLHLAQLAETGLPLLALLLLEVNALVLALMVAGVVAHSATAWLDLRYTAPRRHVPPWEQVVHGVLFCLPVFALAIIAILHWEAWQSLWHPASAPAGSWDLHWRTPPFGTGIVATVVVAASLVAVVPGLLEFARALSARRRRASRDR